ncbi:putative abc transporter [Erysiphe necator]|uniref:Putative abc transporter n=1 Tax=Uncinula necator TaxID=52586 RepID=A0A0B1P4F6_UNCNE|nr:putative abc transporter [Erysiphe necator]
MGMDSNSEVMNINGHFKKNKKPGKETSSTSRAEFNTTRILEFDSSEPPQGEKSWLYKLNPFRQGSVPPVPKEKLVTKEYNAGFISRLYFHWMTPLMAVGYKRQLHENDIWSINPRWETGIITSKLQANFKKQIACGGKNPLIFALYETFKRQFWISGFCQLSASIIQATCPFLLRYLIRFAQLAYNAKMGGPPPPSIGIGLGLVFGLTLLQMVQSLQINHSVYRGMVIGGAARASLISLIFTKAMNISSKAKAGDGSICGLSNVRNSTEHLETQLDLEGKIKPKKKKSNDGIGWSNGRVMNLMSVDTHRVDQASALFHLVWTSPIACIYTLALLTINMTYSALAGFGLLILGILFMTQVTKRLFSRRKNISNITDQRISLTLEIMQAIRFVKLFGWESAFLIKLQQIREKEIHAIQILLAIRNVMNTISISLPIFSSMLTFLTYSLTNHNLEPAIVFSSLALFNSLRIPLNLLPLVISQTTDAWSSISRIQEFLLSEDLKNILQVDLEADVAVEIRNADFTWERTPIRETPSKNTQMKDSRTKFHYMEVAKINTLQNKDERLPNPTSESYNNKDDNNNISKPPFQLQDINLVIGRNELVAVIGGVGCGKSSLLAAIAGDMRKTNGELKLGASRAFCSQSAWIQNTTVRENILFGKEMQIDWYNQVIEACNLNPDLETFPFGDMTEIGERGVTISGGQKQRINIARAIYFDSKIILMDDPLSAVDAHVGRQIFDHAILKLMKDRSRILATHQLWVLDKCDRIVLMKEGHIQAVDTYKNLMRNNADFQRLLDSTVTEKHNSRPTDHPSQDGVHVPLNSKLKGSTLMQIEEKAIGKVPWNIYLDYIRASGSITNAFIALVFLIASQCTNIITSLWVAWWSANYFGYSRRSYIAIYVALGVSQALLSFAFSLVVTLISTISSKKIMNRAITRVLRAPMSFFDTTPLGRITNRFSRDVDIMDNELSEAIRVYCMTLVMILTVFCLIIAYFPFFIIALIPLSIFFLYSSSYYRASGRQLKRIESILRSHVFAKFSEGLSGTACIRAYGVQNFYISKIQATLDDMNSAYFLTFANQRWSSIRIDIIAILLVFVTGILAITSRFDVRPSIVGLVLSYILSIVQMMQYLIRQLAEVENGMNAMERLHYYGLSLEEEAPRHTIEIRKTWPETGEIVFKNVFMRYRDNLPLVLNGFSLHVKSGERLGVVGRTGAGKSSIMMTLFRLVELSAGSIVIDNIDISTIGLHDLRSRLAIIPQDPSLFKGTIRSNLDPFSEFIDMELWSALYQSGLVPSSTQPNSKKNDLHLDSVVDDEGSNFSLGQRQLMALARALVRKSRIVICDEATSSVDMETDIKIQQTMITAFKGITLLCIAHRLKTIINYDRICVLERGNIIELDAPKALWNKGGTFRSMCDKSGISEEDFI